MTWAQTYCRVLLAATHIRSPRGDVPDFTASTASRPRRILLPLSVTSPIVACVHRMKARPEPAHVREAADVPRGDVGPDAKRQTRSTSWSGRWMVGVHESAKCRLFQGAGRSFVR